MKWEIPIKKPDHTHRMTISRSTRIWVFYFSISTNCFVPCLLKRLQQSIHLSGKTCLHRKVLKDRTHGCESLSGVWKHTSTAPSDAHLSSSLHPITQEHLFLSVVLQQMIVIFISEVGEQGWRFISTLLRGGWSLLAWK